MGNQASGPGAAMGGDALFRICRTQGFYGFYPVELAGPGGPQLDLFNQVEDPHAFSDISFLGGFLLFVFCHNAGNVIMIAGKINSICPLPEFR